MLIRILEISYGYLFFNYHSRTNLNMMKINEFLLILVSINKQKKRKEKELHGQIYNLLKIMLFEHMINSYSIDRKKSICS